MSEHRTNLLLLVPGPVYSLEDQFRARLERLSTSFDGALVTLTPLATKVRMGSFEVRTVACTPTGALRVFGRLLRLALGVAAEQRRDRHSIDLVVTYDPLKTGLVGWVVAKLARARLAVEINGDYTALANYAHVRSPVARWTRRRAYMAVARFVVGRADGIKLLYAGQLAPLIGAPRRSVIRTFPNFVDLRGFRDLGETPEVLFVGFPLRVKGVDLLIEAFKQVADRFPDWRLKILGWYPDPRELHGAIGDHPRISHHPPVARSEVAKHIGRCGILVLPSRTEAMGRVLLEAMACSKPRIGTAVGGIPTVIRDGEDGLLVERENVNALAQALARLMGDGALRRRLGANGAARVGTDFGADSYFAHVAEFYSRVLEDRARRLRK